MTKWEYRMKQIGTATEEDASLAEKILGDAGNDGWEAVAFIPDPRLNTQGWVLLKRPARKPASVRGANIKGI
jgi:hypothetical protein